ncbi:uncharacterized protein BDFB_011904 [Asbolus verrucosus]|uniref:Uncharacterized protein n=1 Tax=Asbolus verrucosus TaxID=1661398 RepID=A0A482WBJ1_ASBVE|nr:uncharacterized protein BDFB_011904 [Asbolus verrucosus]
MIFCKVLFYLLIAAAFCAFSHNAECSSIRNPIRSDVIVTKWPEQQAVAVDDTKQPGWMRQQLMKFGEVASRVGNAMGSHATKITAAIDKICDVIKTIIPFLAAVCHVGQFKFCSSATQAPEQLAEAMAPASLNLDEPDKRK